MKSLKVKNVLNPNSPNFFFIFYTYNITYLTTAYFLMNEFSFIRVLLIYDNTLKHLCDRVRRAVYFHCEMLSVLTKALIQLTRRFITVLQFVLKTFHT